MLVACGSGNNGGDGWVAARYLHGWGFPVFVTESGGSPAGAAGDARAGAIDAGVRVVAGTDRWPDCRLIVDALLGVGATGAPRDNLFTLLERLRALDVPSVAVDGPSGLDLGSGDDHGALPAAVSVTFGGLRRGHVLRRDVVGDIVIADIGLPAADEGWPWLVTSRWAVSRLAPIPVRAHKGTRGRVVVVGGAPSMAGAMRLTARAAFGTGAGLVHAVVPGASLLVLRTAEPDVQVAESGLVVPVEPVLAALIEGADAVVLGPGMGRDAGRTDFCLAVVGLSSAIVIDADALHALRHSLGDLYQLAASRHVVLTPHIGEFRMVFPECPVDPERDPWAAATYGAERSGCTVLLKGVPTVVAAPGLAPRTIAAGNPGLATGGSGDVLSGIIGTLLAQGMTPPDAACVGAAAHGAAADHGARRHTVRAMRPMDVVTALPDVWREWSRLDPQSAMLPLDIAQPQVW